MYSFYSLHFQLIHVWERATIVEHGTTEHVLITVQMVTIINFSFKIQCHSAMFTNRTVKFIQLHAMTHSEISPMTFFKSVNV